MSDAGTITIGGRKVGRGQPCFIIAEIGTNHDRSLEKAQRLICAAAQAGVDAVKFQLYEADDIVNRRIRPSEYGLEGLYRETTMHEVFDQRLRTPREWFPQLTTCTREAGLLVFSTVHSRDGAVFAVEQGMDAIKIASMDFTNLPVLAEIADVATVPLILSTGLSDLQEIAETLRVLDAAHKFFALLHCVSNYPARFGELHLQNIPILQRISRVPVGFSDHTASTLAAPLAVALGASLIEVHLTLSRYDPGPDHPFALEPDEMKRLVEDVRRTEAACDSQAGFAGPSERELAKRALYRRSLVARRAIATGTPLSKDDIKITRPGSGIAPKHLSEILGRKARRDIEAESPIDWHMV